MVEKKRRKSEDPLKEVSPAENIEFSLQPKPDKVVRSQSPRSRTGLPNTRGEATSSRLPHPRGQRRLQARGSMGMRMGRGEHNMTLGAAPITHGIQTWVGNM